MQEYEAWTGCSRLSEATARNNTTTTRASKGFYLAVTFDDASACYTAVLMRDGTSMRATALSSGSHAFVKVPGEHHLRVALKGTEFGEAAGHPTLAFEGWVEYAGHIDLCKTELLTEIVWYAGEVEFDADGRVKRWAHMSGTYKCPSATAQQAGLPMENFFFVDLSWRDTGTEVIPRGCVLTKSGVLLKPISSYCPTDAHGHGHAHEEHHEHAPPGVPSSDQKPAAE